MNPISLARDALPTRTPPPGGERRRAAVFSLDNTLVPGRSLLVLGQEARRRKLCSAEEAVRFAWRQFVAGARELQSEAHLERAKAAVLAFARGRRKADVEALARAIVAERIVPSVYPEMARLLERHHAEGFLTYVATAGPAEVAEAVADGLGMTGGLGTHAEVDETGRYSGRLAGPLLYGGAKAARVEQQAAADGIHLSRSFAYSSSVNDLPLLEVVGNAEVVYPDRELRRVAHQRGWPVHQMPAGARPNGPGRPASAGTGVVLRDRWRRSGRPGAGGR